MKLSVPQLQVPKLQALVRAATLAPSSHNTLPWLFRFEGQVIELLADRTRFATTAASFRPSVISHMPSRNRPMPPKSAPINAMVFIPEAVLAKPPHQALAWWCTR